MKDKNYTLKDVVREMGREINSSAPVRFGKELGEALTFAYNIPTLFRRIYEGTSYCGKNGKYINGIEMLVLPFVGLGATFWATDATKDWKYLAALGATNLVSGAYELYRNARKNLDGKIED